MRRPRRNHTAVFKTKVAIAALKGEGVPVGWKRVSTLMRKMSITAAYRKQNTSRKHPGTRYLRTCCAM